ncbi:O-antigen ligase family protein [Sphingomonas sp. BIUV-7]|uniref:O-antigen ligase family protein n=1 Tax=Sphingomonas natans TaxID=3063330 RepID=A0ABT8Y6A5_9SPHN|nr:O-antigen ligase family protein [Sphingomonas sp. BIUV-7]MDO6413532.1 O-antigen ligase family protein [Sphingomonas sp. BIUV-7]
MLGTLSIVVQTSVILFISGNLFAALLTRQDAIWVRTTLLPIMIGLYAFAMLLPNRWVIFAVLAAIIPLMSRSRAAMPPIYLVTVLALPQMTTQVAIGSMYLLDIDKWLITAIGAAIAFALRPARRGLTNGTRFDVPFFLLFALEAAQARGNNFTSILRVETNVVLSYLLPYYVISRSLTRPEDIRRLLLALAFVAFVFSGIAIYESRRGVLLYNVLSQRVGVIELLSAYAHQRGGYLRAAASFYEATSFGSFLCTGYLSMLALGDTFRTRQRRLLGFAGILVGIYMANTRGALLGLVLGTLAFDLFRRRWSHFARNAAILGTIGSVALVIAQFSTSMATRLGLAGDAADTTGYRKLLITRGWEEIRKHPLTGVDPGQAYASLIDLRTGEGIIDFVNTYIWMGLTTGIVGMAAFFLAFTLLPMRLVTIRRRLRNFTGQQEVAAAVFAVAIYYTVAAGTSGFSGRGTTIFYLFLAVGSSLCALRLPRAPAQPSGGRIDPPLPFGPSQPLVAHPA